MYPAPARDSNGNRASEPTIIFSRLGNPGCSCSWITCSELMPDRSLGLRAIQLHRANNVATEDRDEAR